MALATLIKPDFTAKANPNRLQRLETLVASLPVGVVILDGQGRISESNATAKALLGEPLDGEAWLTIAGRAFSPRADDGHEVSLVNGRRVKLDISPLDGEPGQLIVISDLTHTRELQTRISHMQRLSSLGRMVASLAHQIRTPLSAAMLYGGQLAAPLDDGTRQRFQGRLMARLKDLENQMNNMLLFARSDEQKLADRISVAALLQELQEHCESMLGQHGAELEVDLEQDAVLVGNRSALVSALGNLVHNAVQAGARRIRLHGRCQDGRLALRLADDGPGLPDTVLARLGEPFVTTKVNGTGLGLSVVKSVCRAHGADFKAGNDGGAVFTLTFPLADGARP
ncbi:PAS domain-containing sensor histidine kinase [Gallaecimonas sp. GXIMD4217]|uniref:sensor histidine kinase n=1 Tax=Gallaecimonas sp. GXIMD4217 TaxID=3131927 RepID=UPI00311B04C6